MWIPTLKRVQKKYKFNTAGREKCLRLIRKYGFFIEPSFIPNVCRDSDDNYFLAVAEESKANYLITGDKDLLTLKKYKKTKIIKPKEFLEIFNKLH